MSGATPVNSIMPDFGGNSAVFQRSPWSQRRSTATARSGSASTRAPTRRMTDRSSLPVTPSTLIPPVVSGGESCRAGKGGAIVVVAMASRLRVPYYDRLTETGRPRALMRWVAITAMAAAAWAVPASAADAPRETRVQVHHAPQYSLAVPPGAELAEKPDEAAIIIHSRKGYRISLRTNSVDPRTTPRSLATKLEALNLGKGKAWSRKLGERDIVVGGLPAYDALYEGMNTRVRVIVARGLKTDFAFVMVAPPDSFVSLAHEFEWLLVNFKPVPDEIGSPPPAAATAKGEAGRELGKRFSDANLGYSIGYPAGWVMDTPSAFQRVFSGAEGSDAFQAMVDIQNVMPPAADDPEAAAAAALADVKRQLAASASDVSYLGESAFTFERLRGVQFIVAYTHAGQRFRKWVVVAPRAQGGVAHVWSYTAPEAGFERFRPVAEAMFRSWTLDGRGS